jgi:CBS domain-containing protein
MPTIVRDVMTTDVLTVTESTPFKEVAGLLAAYHIGALPVLDATGKLSGIVSETDLLLKQEFPHSLQAAPLFEGRRRRGERRRAEGRVAGALMSSPAITVGADLPVAQAARLMHAGKVKHLPVLDADGELVGIVSRGDLLRVFLRDDEDLLADLRALVADQPGVDPAQVTVLVAGGVVRFTGTVPLRSTAKTLAMLARELDGVVGVDDRLAHETDDLYVSYPIM